MALNKVTLVVDVGSGQGYYRGSGTGYFTPSAVLTDAADHLIADQEAIPVTFGSAAGAPRVQLLATDNAALLPAGWAWTFTPPAGSGMTAFSFFLPYASGASQYLSSQAPVSSGVTQYPHVVIVPPPTGDATGVTDQANVQAALTAAAGGVATFPATASQYLVTGNLKVPPFTIIQGPGWDPPAPAVKLVSSSGASCVFAASGYLTGGTSSDGPIAIRDLAIDVNGANNANCHGIVLMSYNSAVEHCYILNPSKAGIVASDVNSAGTPIGNTAVENVITRNKITWSSPAAASGQYGIWVRDVSGTASTDGYIYDNIIQQPGDYALRVDRAAGWFIAHNHVYQCEQSAIWLDQFWDTFFHDNEVDIYGQAGGASTYYGVHVENVITGREGSIHDNQVSTPELSASTWVYYYVRCPAVTAGVQFSGNFAHKDSGTGASSTAYSFIASTSGALTVYGTGNALDGPATAYSSGGGGVVTFADTIPGEALGAVFGDLLASGDETMPLLSVINSNIQFTSGDMPLTYFTAQKSGMLTQAVINTGSVAGASVTLARIGLYSVNADGSLTLLASTPNDASLFGSTFTRYAKAFSAAYAVSAGVRYALGVLVVAGGTMPGFYGNWIADSSTGLNKVPRKFANVTGLAALPSTVASGSPVATRAAPLYAQVTP